MSMSDNLKGMQKLVPVRSNAIVESTFEIPELPAFQGVAGFKESFVSAFMALNNAGAIVDPKTLKVGVGVVTIATANTAVVVTDNSAHGTRATSEKETGVLVIEVLEDCTIGSGGTYAPFTNLYKGQVIALPIVVGIAATAAANPDIKMNSATPGAIANVYLFASAISIAANDAFTPPAE